jgi:hypothetical protein
MDIVNARRFAVAAVIIAAVALVPLVALATEAELYFASDKNGENRVTKVREGDQVWIVVYDPDEDIDCDVRDKVWTDIKVMDIKTGAHIVWKSYMTKDGDANSLKFEQPGYVPYKGHWPGTTAGFLGEDFLEEVNSSTGLFVSRRPFQIGTRVSFADGADQTHIVGPYDGKGPNVTPTDFIWGNYMYVDEDDDNQGDDRIWVGRAGEYILASGPTGIVAPPRDGIAYLPPGIDDVDVHKKDYMLGRFGNLDTVTGLYVDPDDAGDVALAQLKLNDAKSTITWDREIYPDGNEAATITIVDDDENLNCNKVEKVPVFVIVNPGSWRNQTGSMSATDFCTLKRYGGVRDTVGSVLDQSLVWHNIYNSGLAALNLGSKSKQRTVDGSYYIQYPTTTPWDPAGTNGVTRVMFYASETTSDSGIFELRLNSILRDLGFNSLNVRDVLVAYYIDPNDQDDFSLATAYIEERQHSQLRFTDASRATQDVYWLGRDPVYVELIDENANEDACCPEKVVVHVCDPHEVDDVEWLVLDEMSSNSPIFFTYIGMRLASVWDALGIGDPGASGGYSLRLDNWELEAFNEDKIYARYNDVVYRESDVDALGDTNTDLPAWFPPRIDHTRVINDVSFAVLEVGDTQVFDGDETQMHFLDRNGNRVGTYANSDCVFVEVSDPDQNEDRNRRERIDAYWDGSAGWGQQQPFGPANFASNHAECGYLETDVHPVNALLGDTNIFDDGQWATLYVMNPRTGRWAPLDLVETGIDTGVFVSVTCVDLVDRYDCVPTLGVLPGDTLLAAYQDPSNHSDVAWVSIRVAIGGAAMTGSTTQFVDVEGDPVAAYLIGEPLYVKVIDSSLSGAGSIPEALSIDGATYDLVAYPAGGSGAFWAGPIDLVCNVGDKVTATYTDPSDPSDTSSATVQIVAGTLDVDRFYAAPSPFDDEATFAYVGDGLAETFAVFVYNLSGRLVWSALEENVLGVVWDGVGDRGDPVANGAYIYVVTATGNGRTFQGKGTLFVNR